MDLYRIQNTELEAALKEIESQSPKSKESIEKDFSRTENDEIVKELKARLIKAELENEQIQQEKEKLNKQIDDLTNEVEQKDANINSLKKKIFSLIQENDKFSSAIKNNIDTKSETVSIPSENPSLSKFPSEAESPKNKFPEKIRLDGLPDIFRTQSYEDEIKNLKESNERLLDTLEK